ncbi:hypothetical protein PFICI_11125 [Pestalotiopsis fici W106-1]|uniref:Uncharacterized protein n=1 Tax=Pestalotiopsis fici (strain W106-1 / CGMCC3.15140) TaxID=1229662 RepID=W3WWL2_PESFW|nr:uncharacterized protein PFICI_11125 [Pestalotiopsis fici W106-1]ETS77251.1 hypothetical protein PFICI_11125 [Pestalotiopsis fici W106-1]
MGGTAFSHIDPLNLFTPRMPPNVYHRVRDDCHAALRQRFLAVATPIQAPGKKNFGDVDIFVAWDTEQSSKVDFDKFVDSIRDLLGATYSRYEGLVNCDAQFAVAWPDDPYGLAYSDSEENPRFCQIDVHICNSIEAFHWNMWYYAHGDLMPMIRNIMRPYDLVINARGLFLRIPEIRDGAKKVFVTDEPSQALGILGYDPMAPVYQESFQNVDELFVYTTKCRLFKGFYGTDLTDEDGRSMSEREVFKTWIRDFVPTCIDGYPKEEISKDAIRNEIFQKFPATKAEYDASLLRNKKRKQRDFISRTIESSLDMVKGVTSAWRKAASAALKEIILFSDYSLGFRPLEDLKLSNGLYKEDEVKMFIEQALEVVGEVAWERQCCNDHMGDISQAQQRTRIEEEDLAWSEGEDEIFMPKYREGYYQNHASDCDLNYI